MQYNVLIRESYSRVVTVIADSEKEAIAKVDKAVGRGDIILDDEDYFGRDVNVVAPELQKKYLQ